MNILILTGSFGMGHVSAANAIKEELEHELPESSVEIVDLVHYLFPSTSKVIYGGFDFLAGRFHGLYNMLNRIDEQRAAMPLRNWFVERFEHLINVYSPDVLISTWPVGSRYIGMYKKVSGNKIPYITCITDITAHREWLSETTGAYVVGDDESKEIMVEKGIDAGTIFVGGIPTRLDFKEEIEKPAGRERRTKEVLIMGGGLGLIPHAEDMLAYFESLTNVHVTVITGHNEKLREDLTGRYANADIIGFTDKVADYMKNADILISKAGGITMFEAIYSETPIFVPHPFLEQEKNNARYIEKKNIGMVIDYGESTWETMCRDILESDDRLLDMHENMKMIKQKIAGNGVITAMKSLGAVA